MEDKELTAEEEKLISKVTKYLKVKVNVYAGTATVSTFYRGRRFKFTIDLEANDGEWAYEGIFQYVVKMMEYITVECGIPIVKGKWYDIWYIKGYDDE